MSQPESKPVGSAHFALCLLPIAVAALLFALWSPLPANMGQAQIALGVASLGWLTAVLLAARGRGHVGLVVGGAIALRLFMLASDPGLSDDIYRYVWEGELVGQGVSPYAHAPDAPELAEHRARLPEVYERLNNKDISAAYPPLVQYANAAVVYSAHRSRSAPGLSAVFALRLFYSLCDLLVLWPLMLLLARAGKPRALAVAWGWSPLVMIEFAGSGHFDSLGILALVTALVVFGERAKHAGRGLALLACAVLVKFVPVVAAPFLLRGKDWWKRGLLLAGLLVGMYLPILLLQDGTLGLFTGLKQYGLRWESGSLVFRWIDSLVRQRPGLLHENPQVVARAVMGGMWVLFAAHAWLRGFDPVRGTGRLLAAWLVLTPTLHPWYLTWILPFFALRPLPAWGWLCAAAPLLYWPLVEWQRQEVWEEPAWVWPVLAVPFFAWLVIDAWRPRARSAS